MSSNTEHGKRVRAIMLEELERKPLGLEDLSALLHIRPASVKHHLKKLQSAGQVYIARWKPSGGGPSPLFRAGFGGVDAPRPLRNEDIVEPEVVNPHELIQSMVRVGEQAPTPRTEILPEILPTALPPPTQPSDDLILSVFRQTAFAAEGEGEDEVISLTTTQTLQCVRTLFRLAGYGPLKWPEPGELTVPGGASGRSLSSADEELPGD